MSKYKGSKEIRPGDEVTGKGRTGIATADCAGWPALCHVMWRGGETIIMQRDRLEKTGRNFVDRLDALLGEIGADK